MEKLSNIIRQSDIVSDDIRLRIQNGNTNYKTLFGGLISILSYSLILASIIYFMEKFFNRKESTIISNEKINNDVSIDNFSELPFMIRISDNNGIVKEKSNAYWKFFMSYWWAEKNMTDPIQGMYKRSESIQLSPCDLNNPIHFNEKYRKLFSNVTDINTYFCPDYTKNMSLFGIYGDINPFSYFHFSLRACINEIDNNICAPASQLKSYMSNVYFDYITIDYTVDSHSIIPYFATVSGKRFLVSNTLYRRIWMNYKTVFYESDFGYIFEQKKTDHFFQIAEFSSDINLNLPSGIVPNTILGVTISNLNKTNTISRYYSKAQNFLANVGGIIKGITLIAYLLNYMISSKLYNLYLINHLPEVKYLVLNGIDANNFASKKLKYKESSKNFVKLSDESNLDYKIKSDNIYEVGNDSQNKEKSINNIDKINKMTNLNNEKNNELNDRSDILKLDKINNNSNENFNDFKEKKSSNIVSKTIGMHKDHSKSELLNMNDIKKKFDVNNEGKIKLPNFEKYIDISFIKQNFEIELSWYHLIFPDFLIPESNLMFKYYKKSLDYLVQEMDVANMINKLNQFEKLKQSNMTYDQLILFNFLFQTQNKYIADLSIYKHLIEYKDFEKSLNEIKSKDERDNLEEYLISIIKD